MIKIYSHLALIALTLSLFVASCDTTNESNTPSNKKKEIIKELFSKEKTDETPYVYEPNIDSMMMEGYLGDAKITVELISDGLVLNGTYFYNKYNKPITLTGEYEEGADWGPMSLTETNKKGEITGYWELSSDNQRLNYLSDGFWEHPETGKTLPIVLYDKSENMYLDNESKMMFKSEAEAVSFFNKHQFLNNQTYHKPGYIITDDFEKQYESPLPVGITIWSINSYNFDEDEAYTLLEGNKVENQESGEVIDLEELTESIIEIDYEISAFRFQYVNNDQQFILEDGYRQIAINASDLEVYGYHAVGEAQWYKDKSGSVLGYFPSNSVNYFDKKDDYSSPIFLKPDITSEILLNDGKEELGFFSVLDVKLIGIQYWAKVRFDYHEEVPCDGTLLTPLPSIEGWIRFYNDSKSTSLGYYTRGC